MIGVLIFTILAACLLSVLCNWLARAFARRIGLVDRPDGHRKLQGEAIPLAGGIGIFLSIASAVSLLAVFSPAWRSTLYAHRLEATGLLLASLMIIGVGVLDDYMGLRGRQKLLGQIAAATILVAFGVDIQRIRILEWQFELGVFAAPFTIFWLVGAMNALNLLDGIDGLVATLGVVLSGAVALMAFIGGHETIGLTAAAMAGSLIGFLRFNLPPASMYLGDAGSMFIGFFVGVLAIRASLTGPGTAFLGAPLALWAIPIFDVAAAIARRKLTGRSIYTTDRAHLHHRLVQRIGHGPTLACLALASLLTSTGALLGVWWNRDGIAIVCALLVVMIFVSLRVFGHSEVLLALVRTRAFLRSMFTPRRTRRDMPWDDVVRLQGSRQWDQLWRALIEQAKLLNLVEVRLDVNVPRLGEGYNACWNRPVSGSRDRFWRLDLPLLIEERVMGFLKVVGEREGAAGNSLPRLLELLDRIEAHLTLIALTESVGEPQPDSMVSVEGVPARPLLDLKSVATSGVAN